MSNDDVLLSFPYVLEGPRPLFYDDIRSTSMVTTMSY